jgi:hypothetical protein
VNRCRFLTLYGLRLYARAWFDKAVFESVVSVLVVVSLFCCCVTFLLRSCSTEMCKICYVGWRVLGWMLVYVRAFSINLCFVSERSLYSGIYSSKITRFRNTGVTPWIHRFRLFLHMHSGAEVCIYLQGVMPVVTATEQYVYFWTWDNFEILPGITLTHYTWLAYISPSV